MITQRFQSSGCVRHMRSALRNASRALAMGLAALLLSACAAGSSGEGLAATRYAVDPYWPKPLPGKWQLGAVAGVAVDKHDHIWIIHRPGSFTDDEKAASFNPPRAACCVPAPSVIEFDAEGNVLRSWGMAGV